MKILLKLLFGIFLCAISFSINAQQPPYDVCAYPTNMPPDQMVYYGGWHKTSTHFDSDADSPLDTLGDSYSWGSSNVVTIEYNIAPTGTERWWGANNLLGLTYGCGQYSAPHIENVIEDGSLAEDLAGGLNGYLDGTITNDADNTYTEQHSSTSFSVSLASSSGGSTITMSVNSQLLDPYLLNHNIDDSKDHCTNGCPDSADDPDSNSDNGLSDILTGGDDDVTFDEAMPRWYISQPYLNLWVRDCPVFYTTSLGKKIGFDLSYKQRDTRPLNTTVPPTGWSHNWFSYVHFVVPICLSGTNGSAPGQALPSSASLVSVDSAWVFTNNYSQWQAILYNTGDSQNYFDYNNDMDSQSGQLLLPATNGVTGGFKLIHPDGSVDEYAIVSSPTFSFGFVTNKGQVYDVGAQPSKLFSFCGANYCNTGSGYVEDQGAISTLEQSPPIGRVTGSFIAYDALLTKRIDAYGNSVNLYYNSNAPYYLQSIVDYDGRTTTLSYDGNGMLNGVSMPYGRSASFVYTNKQMILITDAQGMSSSFSYTAVPSVDFKSMPPDPTTMTLITNNYLSSLTTPYGTTTFNHYEMSPFGTVLNPPSIQYLGVGRVATPGFYDGSISLWTGWGSGSNCVNRACTVTYPDGTHELYMYRYDSRGLVPTNYPSTEVAYNDPWLADDGLDSYSLDMPYSISHLMSTRNSFHWNRQQYALLSSTNINQLNTNDYAVATMKHWLENDVTETAYPYASEQNLSDELSMVRAASPDGVREGKKTWFDDQSRPLPWQAGNGSQVTAATLLPGGGVRQKTTSYNNGLLSSITTSCTDENGDANTRTKSYDYDNIAVNDSSGNYLYSYWRLDWISLPSGYYTYDDLSDDNSERDVYDPYGETSYFYNTRHQVTGIKHANGLTTTNIYGSDGFLAEKIDIESASTNYYSFANGLPSSTTSPLGLQLNYSWDNLSRLQQITFPDSTTIFNVYNKLDLVAHKDRLNHWTYSSYDSLDQPSSSTDANGNVTHYSYCFCGGLASVTDPLGNVTVFTRDNDGNIISATSTDGFSVYYNCDILGQATNITTSAGLNLNYVYNNQGLVTNISSSQGTLFAATYNTADQPVYVTDAQGVGITNQFDSYGRIATRQNAFGWSQNWYSAQGITQHKDALNHYTYYNYDPAGRLAGTQDANGNTNGFTYNPLGQISTLTDGNSHVTSWTYDIYGHKLTKQDGDGVLVVTNGYDANGRLTTSWTPAKGPTHYTYDANGNPLTTTYSSGTGITATFDGLNRILSLNDAVGASAFTYTNFGAFQGALATEVGPWADSTVTHTYANRVPQSLVLSQPSGNWTENLGYDSLLRLHTLSSPAGTFTYTYNGAGKQIQSLALPGSSSIAQSYDAAGQLLSTALQYSSTTLDAATYAYDADGNRTSVTRANGSQVGYTYDNINQLTGAVGLEPDGVTLRNNENFSYSYDPAGNLAQRSNNTLVQNFSTDGANQLMNIARNNLLTFAGNLTNTLTSLAVNGQSAALYADLTFAVTNGVMLNDGLNEFTTVVSSGLTMTNVFPQILPASVNLAYDANGNLISDGLHGYAYDCANELVSATVTNAWQETFAYDGFGRRRINKQYVWGGSGWTETNEVHYVYDGMNVIQERDVNNNPLVSYTRGVDLSGTLQGAGGIGGLLARTDGNGSTFYHADGNGNVTALVNSSGQTVAKYLYDSYGNSLGMWGTLAAVNKCRFSSQEIDLNSGMYYYAYRYYLPNLQRWLNRDPIGEAGGINLYDYVANNPINEIDPLGLQDGMANPGNTEPLAELEAEACGEKTAAQKAKEALENKLRHIFDKPQHKLDSVLKQFNGDREKAFNAINDALKNQNLPDNQLFQTTVKIGNDVVTVLGKTINGVSNIGTAYIP